MTPPVSATTSDSGVASRNEPGVRTSPNRSRAASKNGAGSRTVAMFRSSGAAPGHLRGAGGGVSPPLRGRAGRALLHPPRRPVVAEERQVGPGGERLGAEYAGARPGAAGQQLEGDDGIDRGLPHDRLGSVAAPSLLVVDDVEQ